MTHPSATRHARVVLFDLDGTLIDSIELIRRCCFHTFAVHLGRDPLESEWLHGLGRPLREQFHALGVAQEMVDTMIATYRAYNAEHHDTLVQPYPGVRDAVVDLRERGVRLGIVTSKLNASARRGLLRCGFEPEWFEVIVGVDDVTRHKPDPEPVRHALARMAASADQAVYVGDSPHDVAAGRGAGTATAGVLWGAFRREMLQAAGPDRLLAQPDELALLA